MNVEVLRPGFVMMLPLPTARRTISVSDTWEPREGAWGPHN